MSELKKTGKPLRHGACGYVWLYNGQSQHYATCPRCLGKVRVGTYKLTRKEREKLGV